MNSEFKNILLGIVLAITTIIGTNSGANKVQVLLAWVPPEVGVVKLNIDGSRRGVTGAIGARKVLKDHLGQWIGGFVVNLGRGEVIEAELWGMFFGLNLAVKKKVDDIVIEMDFDTAVLLIQRKVSNACHPNAGLVSSCKRLMNLFRRIKLQHIYRERGMMQLMG
ncbi:unnamed protein product [Prunus armeniaca]